MKEQLITYETALLAKNKNFDINTYSNCWLKLLSGKIIHSSDRENILEHDRCEQYLMQPSQSLLQKWLREKHNIHISILYGELSKKYMGDVNSVNTRFIVDLECKYHTYEEALEAGLQEALKLIK